MKKINKILASCCLMCTAVLSSAATDDSITSLKKDLLFYVPFNGSATPLISGGSRDFKSKSLKFSNGVVGEAVELSKHPLEYNAFHNMLMQQGTIAFWHKPAWQPEDENAPASRVLFHLNNFQIAYYGKNRLMYFMTGSVLEQAGFKWHYGSFARGPAKWKQDDWHHIVISWDYQSGRKSLYIDGQSANHSTTKLMPKEIFNEATNMLLNKANTPGYYDELMIWGRELAPNEVMTVAAKPAHVAATLGAGTFKNGKIKLIDTLSSILEKQKNQKPLKLTIKKVLPISTIIEPGQEYTATIPMQAGPSGFEGEITFNLLDFWKKTIDTKHVKLKLNTNESKEISVAFKPLLNGVFKVGANVTTKNKQWVKDVASFVVWPKPEGPRDPDSFFGNHVNSWAGGTFIDQAARLGQGWMRNHNMLQSTWWARVEPEEGNFAYTADKSMDYVKKYNMPVLGQLFSTPYWAAADGPKKKHSGYPKSWFPKLDAFENYVTKAVNHYKDYIKHWEIGNEPAVGLFWQGTPEQFGQWCQTASLAAKKADPDCTVMVAGFTSPAWNFHLQAAKAGALKYADAISFHYGCPDIEPEVNRKKLKVIIDHFQGLAVKYGPGHEVPLWNTEGGSGGTTFFRGLDYPGLPPEDKRQPLSWHQGALKTIKGEAVIQSLGVKKHFIYFQNSVKKNKTAFLNTSMLDVNNAPSPKLFARVVMAAQVDWSDFKYLVQNEKGRFWASIYQKRRENGSVIMCWAGKNGKLNLSANWPGKINKIVDMMGNDISINSSLTLNEAPVYIHIDASADQVEAALKNASIDVLTEPTKIKIVKEGEDKPNIPTLPDYVAPEENPLGCFTVDLRPYANMGFADEVAGDGKGGWSDEGRLNDMRDFPTGKQKWYGVPFDIIEPDSNNGKAVITLKGKGVTPHLPKQITGIKLNHPVRVLYFLHSAAWGVPGDIGKYVINYEDGEKAEIPISVVKNSNNWWMGYNKNEISKPIAIQVSNTTTGKLAWRYPRIFEWENPKLTTPVKSIDFISNGGVQSPILIGISGVGSF